MSQLPPDRSGVRTEHRNERTMALGTASVSEAVRMIRDEDRRMVEAVAEADAQLVPFIEAAEPGFVRGGRVVYLGAGTSGRLGVLDASEAPPTFCVEDDRIIGIIAGGDSALRKSSEHKEDDPRGAVDQLEPLNLNADDAVVGIAAGGTTPYVLGALEWAAALADPPVTAMISCSPIEHPEGADHLIMLDTGPEALTGSTRMKAGSATKLALNTISTVLMVRSGRVHENLMVDVRATNDKLRDRAARIVSTLTGLGRAEAFDLVGSAGSVKTAVVMHRLGLDRAAAEAKLADAGGRLGGVL